jgi:hypothetical protein
MRPVLKGDGAGYVPKTTLTWNKTYKDKITQNWQALSNVFGNTSSPLVLTVAACLQKVLEIDLKAVTSADEKTARAAIMEKVGDVYKLASLPLVQAMGAFCAYCENTIAGVVEVEHIANKDHFPTYMATWANFLPACGPCNTVKSNNPSRATVAGWPPAIPVNQPDDTPFYGRIREHYAWPDLYNDTFQYFGLVFQMSKNDGASWVSLSLADAVDLQTNYMVRFDLKQRKVWADLWHDQELHEGVLARVLVLPENDNLVALCGLNKMDTEGTYDRRLFNRTLAWFTALDILRPIMQIENEQQFLQLWPVVHYMSVGTGFWSLWVTILSQFNDFDDPPHSLGFWLWGDPHAADFYPGTNTADIRLPPRQR